MKKVSVVIPTYNRAYCLRRTIQSVVDQTYHNWELLVVDNTSRDNTRDVVERFEDDRIKFLQVKNNGVIGKSRNYGIQVASGELIAFLDSDDSWLPEKLERSVSALEGGCRFVHHDLYISNGIEMEKARITNIARRLTNPVVEDLIRGGNAVCTSSVVVEAELIRDVDGFSEDPELVGIEDYDLWVRVAERSEGFAFVEEPLGFYTIDGNGTLNVELAMRGLKGWLEFTRTCIKPFVMEHRDGFLSLWQRIH